MALKAVINKSTYESLDNVLKAEYKPGEKDDEFVLDVTETNGLKLANVNKLQSAVTSSRRERDEAQQLLKQWGDLTPEKAREAISQVDELKGDVDKKVQAQIKAAKEQLVEQHNNAINQHRTRNEALQRQVTTLLRTNKAKAAIMAAGGIVDLLLPHVERFIKLEAKDDGTFVEKIIDPSTGEERIDGQAKPMTLETVVGELRSNQTFASAFNGTGSSGTGGTGGGGGASTLGAHTISTVDAKDPSKYRTAREAAVKAGRQLQIVE